MTQFISQGPQLSKLTRENFTKWHRELSNSLFVIDAEDHIKKPVAELEPPDIPEDTRQNVRRKRMMALNLIIQSLSDANYNACINNGYVDASRDPFKLLQAIQVIFRQTPNHDKLVLCRRTWGMHIQSFNSLHDWWNNMQEIMTKDKALYPDKEEDSWVLSIVVALGDHLVGTRLAQEYGFNRLTMSMVVVSITDAIDQDRKSPSTYFVSKPKGKTSSNPRSDRSAKPDVPMIDCKMCKKKHPKEWPECEYYDHHHPGTCWMQFPKRAPPSWKMPAKLPKKKERPISNQVVPVNQPSVTTFDLAGYMASQQLHPDSRNRIMYDTGANQHIFNNKAWFRQLTPLQNPIRIDSSSGEKPELTLGGNVSFQVARSDGRITTIHIVRAILNEDCPCNLVSGELLRQATGIWYYGYDDRLVANDRVTEVAQLINYNNHPYFIVKNVPQDLQHPLAMLTVSIDIMHRRLMHSGIERVKQVCRRQGIKLRGTTLECESCALGKSTEIPHRGPPSRQVTASLQLI